MSGLGDWSRRGPQGPARRPSTLARQESRWGSATHWAFVLLLSAALWFARWATTSPGAGWNDVSAWLDAQSLSTYKLLFKQAGTLSVTACSVLDIEPISNGYWVYRA